jgi:hypothetical protein
VVESYIIPGIPRVKRLVAAFPQTIMVLGITVGFKPLRSIEVAIAVEARE